MKKNYKNFIVFCIVCFLGLQSAVAGFVTWTGGTDYNWATPSNWNTNTVPITGDDVTISAATPYPKLTGNVSVKSLTIAPGASLDLQDKQITITDKLDNNGTLTGGTGAVIFSGNTTIEGSGTFNFYNLIVSSGTLTYESNITINGTLTCTVGDFKHGGTNKTVTATGTNTKIKAANSTPSSVKLYALNIRLGKKLICEGNIDITHKFTDNGNFVHSSGNIIFDGTTSISGLPGETKFKKITVQGGTLTVNKKIAVSDLEIINTGTLTLSGELTVKNELKNNGSFDANGKKVTLEPSASTMTVIGTSNAGDTAFAELSMTGAGGKTLFIHEKITVATLKLEGSSATNTLTVGGVNNAEITLSASQTGGKWLTVQNNIPIKDPYTYTAVQSIPDGPAPYARNWVFGDPSILLIWSGSTDNDWNNPANWEPALTPGENTPVKIPASKPRYPKLESATNAKAGTITVEAGGEIDMNAYTISTTGPAKSTLTLKGTAKMTGTADQAGWFGTGPNKLEIKPDSTAVYYGNSAANIWNGPYQNLQFDNKPTINAGNLTVDKTLTVKNGMTTLNAASMVNKLEIASSYDTLQLGGILTIKEVLNNSQGGVFNAGTNDVRLDLQNSPNNNIIIKSYSKDRTKFSKLECLPITSAGKTLFIEGAISVSGPNSLAISGQPAHRIEINSSYTGDIWLDNKQECRNLTVYTDKVRIKGQTIAGKRFFCRLFDSSGAPAPGNTDKTKNGWIFAKDFSLVNSFAKAGTKELYFVINKTGFSGEEFYNYDGITVKIGAIETTSIVRHPSYDSYLPSGHSCWRANFSTPITAAQILDQSAQVELVYFNDKPVKKKKYISDIGIDMVQVLYASNTRTIHTFDGSEFMPLLTTTIMTKGAGPSQNFKMYLHSSLKEKSFWSPKNLPNPNSAVVPVQPDISHYVGIKPSVPELTGTPAGSQLKFTIPETSSELQDSKYTQFMFVYDGWLPCARSKGIDILDLDVWKFDVAKIKRQRGGVSILNNVIDPHQGQECTIQVTVRKPGSLTVQVMSLDGSVVKTLERGKKEADSYAYYWNGTNSSGNTVARGMYFIRISGPDIDEIRKVLVIRE